MLNDEVIDAVLARSLHADTCRREPLVGWIVMVDPPDYRGRFTARLVTSVPSPYVLTASTLAELRAQLPPMLERSDRQPSDLPEVVEIWFSR
jgi:hypothetical protein